MPALRSGAQAFCDVLQESGVDCVFGLPGTQTVGLYEALRVSAIRTIVPTHELSAAFMANGYARASGRVGVLLTIPGPGFAFALAGLAEARLDGVAVVHVTLTPARGPTGEPAFQALDQAAIARPLVKAVLRADSRAELPGVVRRALALAKAADAGPVFVEFTGEALRNEAAEGRGGARDDVALASVTPPSTERELDGVVEMVAAARHPAIFVACECTASAALLASVATKGRVPVFVPPPSRGAVPEDHPWTLCFDDQRTPFAHMESVLALVDLVVVLGTRLSHVSTAGFRLKLPPERVVCISESGAGLPHGYSARTTVLGTPAEMLSRLERAAPRFISNWTASELADWRDRFARDCPADPPEPVVEDGMPAAFFAAVRSALPRDAFLVTDSGLHQVLVRRHYPVLCPAGLVLPSDFQSMGFGLPAAIGAKVAAPERAVVVVMGDGGFAMSGLELLTAARERVPVVVIVFNDGQLNLIRLKQLREFGRSHGVELKCPDFERFADAVGVRYRTTSGDVARTLEEALSSKEPTLIEVIVGDSRSIRRVKARSFAREQVRNALGPRLVRGLKQLLR